VNILQITLGFLPATAWGGPVIQPGTFEDVVDGIRVVYFDTWRFPWWPGTLGPIWLPDLKARLRRELSAFDVVHLNGYRSLMNLQVVDAIQDADIPLVIQPHGAMPVIVNSFLVKRIYDRLLGRRELERAQAFIALQKTERDQILSYAVPPELIHVIPNGLDPRNYDLEFPAGAFRGKYEVPPSSKLILFLGRINRKKGVDMLIEAFAQLKDMEAVLAIVGPDDGQLAEVQMLIARHELSERIILTGLLSGRDVLEAYRDADLFVLPCRTDTFPTTIMEACLMRTPMVITEDCEIAPLVKDRVAEVTPFNATMFSFAIRELIMNKDKYEQYCMACDQLIRSEFSIQNTVDQLDKLYQQLTGKKK